MAIIRNAHLDGAPGGCGGLAWPARALEDHIAQLPMRLLDDQV